MDEALCGCSGGGLIGLLVPLIVLYLMMGGGRSSKK